MRIVIDHHHDAGGNKVAEQVIHTERAPWNQVKHPTIAGQMMDTIDFLAYLQANPAARVAAGFAEVSQLPGEAAPMTRWQRLVNASKQPTADAAVQALNLS